MDNTQELIEFLKTVERESYIDIGLLAGNWSAIFKSVTLQFTQIHVRNILTQFISIVTLGFYIFLGSPILRLMS